ncbi:NAD(P)H-dependent oxidoreductase [Mannheimia haemolytica]|nr:NAD(P)H-dependent oxidoreductase [Mannheimia haemolytica]STY63163.1 Putative NAD(P)H nitroreductase [Mannheimia haemolytica]
MFNISKQQVLDAFHFRAACRSYDPNKKISKEDMDYILELGRLSPSSVGSEPWKFLVLQNPETRQKIAPVSWGIKHPMEEMSHLVVILTKKNVRYDSVYMRDMLAKRGLTDEQIEASLVRYKSFQEEDMKLLSERELFDWSTKQTYIALGNMMTGAALIGIDSCPIEGFHYDTVNQILSDEGLFDLNEYGVSCMITFGYRNKEIKKKSRKPTEEVIAWIE